MRSLELTGYRKTKQAFYEHISDLANRAKQAEKFGAKDLGDPNSTLSKMVAAAENPEKAAEILNSQLGRVAKSPDAQTAANAINTFEATVKLPLFAISNLNQGAAIGMRTTGKNFVKALGDTLKVLVLRKLEHCNL